MNVEDVVEMMKKDFVVYLLVGLALLGCLWTLHQTNLYQKECNDFYHKQFESYGLVPQENFTEKFKYDLVLPLMNLTTG